MRRLRCLVTVAAVLGAAGYLLYRFGLTEEARESVKSAARTAREAGERVSAIIDDNAGAVEHPEDLPNRRATVAQWEALGY